MGEFYDRTDRPDLTDPADDPVLTIRMQPPDTQARRLDLATPRAVKVEPGHSCPWVLVDTESRIGDRRRFDRDVAGWPIVHPITVGAAQRLAAGRETGSTGPAPALPSDEDERPFR